MIIDRNVEEWLIRREEEAIDTYGYFSYRAEFWGMLLDGRQWWRDRFTPQAWLEHYWEGSLPPTWAELRKQGHTRYSKLS